MEKWSDEMLEGAIKLLKEGKTYQEIAFLFNKSYNSVRSKLFRVDLKITDYTEYEKHKIKHCLECGKEIDGYKKFCNSSCAASFNNKYRNKKEKKHCINCGKEISRNKYCSNLCQGDYEKKEYIKKWKNNEMDGMSGKLSTSSYIKNYMLEKYDNKCMKCGWNKMNPFTKKIPLQLEHIDGNYANNKEENLIILCPSCHSLTPTYGARNKGNGRPRYKI